MLEAVGAQLLDKGLSFLPGHKLSGADLMALMEHAVKHGFAMGIVRVLPRPRVPQVSPPARSSSGGPRGRRSRDCGAAPWAALMTGGKPQLDSRKGRTLVVVPQLRPGGAEVKEQGKCWWAEKDDLVLCLALPVGPRQRHVRARWQGSQRRRSSRSSRRCSAATGISSPSASHSSTSSMFPRHRSQLPDVAECLRVRGRQEGWTPLRLR